MEDYKKRKRYKRSDFTLDKSGTGVRVPDDSSAALEGALRSFKKNLKEAGKIDEYKESPNIYQTNFRQTKSPNRSLS